jgi:Uma2 family endonuclease
MALTTQPPAAPAARDPDVPTVPIYRLTVAQYHAMAEAGILGENDPVELLEGWLVKKMTKNPAHCLALGLVQDALLALLPRGWHLKVQGSTTTTDSQPEPDLAVVRGQRRDYTQRHPGPQDVGLVVEVADSSLGQDRDTKKRLYARARFEVYWIVNLIERRIEVYTDPSGPADEPDYRQQQIYTASDTIPVLLDGVEVGRFAVQEFLP